MKTINVLILVSLIGMASCKKEQVREPLLNPTASGVNGFDERTISIVNNRLVFSDEAAFINYMNWAKDNPSAPEKIKRIVSKKGLTSMMDVYEKGMKQNKETAEFSNFCKAHPTVFNALESEGSIIYELQGSVLIAYIANENGIYQVGKKIHRITVSHSYTINNGDESKISMLLLPAQNIADPAIEITSNNAMGTRGEYSYKTSYFDSKHRIVARLYSFASSGAYSYEARTTAQNKGWTGIWTQENVSRVSVSWPNGYCRLTNGKSYVITAHIYNAYNSSDVNGNVMTDYNDVDHSQSSLLAAHSGLRSGISANVNDNDIWP